MLAPVHPPNPFTRGRVVEPARFVGRQEALYKLFQDIRSQESLILVGEPKVGKTSLLTYLVEKAASPEWRSASGRWAVVMMSGLGLDESTTPAAFWRRVLSKALSTWNNPALSAVIPRQLEATTLPDETLRSIFDEVKKQASLLVLLLDEGEVLVEHPGLTRDSFWGLLRVLASQSQALCYVMASRESQAELEKRLKRVGKGGSERLNTATTYRLGLFSEAEVGEFFDRTQQEGQMLTAQDRKRIRQLAGRHPYLLQLASYHLWQVRAQQEVVTEATYEALAITVVTAADAYFHDTWNYLGQLEQGSEAQTILIMLTLKQLNRGSHSLKDLEKASLEYLPYVNALKDVAVLEEEAGQLRLASQVFGYWIARNKLGAALSDPQTWLTKNERIFGRLTRGSLQKAAGTLAAVYREIKSLVGMKLWQ